MWEFTDELAFTETQVGFDFVSYIKCQLLYLDCCSMSPANTWRRATRRSVASSALWATRLSSTGRTRGATWTPSFTTALIRTESRGSGGDFLQPGPVPVLTRFDYHQKNNISTLSPFIPQAFSFARKPGAVLMNRLLLGNWWQDNSRQDIAAPYDTKVNLIIIIM